MQSKLNFPVRIRSQNVELDDSLKRVIETEAMGLQRFNSRIVDCEVAVTGTGKHHRNGASVDIVVRVSLPGPDVVVHRSSSSSIPVAINQTFDTARRRVKRQAHLRRRRVPLGRTAGVGQRGRHGSHRRTRSPSR